MKSSHTKKSLSTNSFIWNKLSGQTIKK